MTPLYSLQAFDRILQEGATLTSEPERIQMLCSYYLELGASELSTLDPFSSKYKAAALKLYSEIAGVANYDPAVNEKTDYLSDQDAATQPSVFRYGESRQLGDFYAAAGHILQVLDVKRGDKVLEYGAGEGQISLALARMGCDVHIIDVDQRYLDIVTRQAKNLGVTIQVKQGLFGEGFGDLKFDRILFYEAFHHAFDHHDVLERMREHLAPGGQIVFSGEPILPLDSKWSPALAFPWGPRLDGLSLAAMRSYGWCELGFRQGYFIDALMRAGYLVSYRPCSATDRGACYVATVNDGLIDLTMPFLISDWQENCGWSAPEHNLRWTTGRAVLPLPNHLRAATACVDLINHLPIDQKVAISAGGQPLTIALASRTASTVKVPCAGANYLVIDAPAVRVADVVPGSKDPRTLGIAVSCIRLA